jgi:hypothetical protein
MSKSEIEDAYVVVMGSTHRFCQQVRILCRLRQQMGNDEMWVVDS